jgi:hypothetical protein
MTYDTKITQVNKNTFGATHRSHLAYPHPLILILITCCRIKRQRSSNDQTSGLGAIDSVPLAFNVVLYSEILLCYLSYYSLVTVTVIGKKDANPFYFRVLP